MWFSSWLHKKQRSPAPHRRSKFRPTLEALEGRWLPSSGILTVTSITDGGKGSLRSAIAQTEQSKGTDTIVFNLKTTDQDYTGHWTIWLTPSGGPLNITNSLNIQGPGAGQLAISAGHNNGFGVFHVYGQVSLSGMCIENGGNGPYPVSYGGGIYNDGTLTVSGCRLTNNFASFQGGGIYNSQIGSLTVSGCDLNRNVAGDGGDGGAILNRGTLTVSNSTLSFNSAGYGGAIANGGSLTVSGSTLSFNSATAFGGVNFGNAIDTTGTLTVSGSTFVHNDIDGIYTDGGGNTFVTSAPQINSLTASAATVTAGSPLTLTANITDPNPSSSITEVEFSDANGLVGYGTQTSPGVWTLTFSTTGWTAGTYTFSVWAVDNYGTDTSSGGSPTVTVQVT
jgi:hypothetical protein